MVSLSGDRRSPLRIDLRNKWATLRIFHEKFIDKQSEFIEKIDYFSAIAIHFDDGAMLRHKIYRTALTIKLLSKSISMCFCIIGRKGVYNTLYRIIEFTHTKRSIQNIPDHIRTIKGTTASYCYSRNRTPRFETCWVESSFITKREQQQKLKNYLVKTGNVIYINSMQIDICYEMEVVMKTFYTRLVQIAFYLAIVVMLCGCYAGVGPTGAGVGVY